MDTVISGTVNYWLIYILFWNCPVAHDVLSTLTINSHTAPHLYRFVFCERVCRGGVLHFVDGPLRGPVVPGSGGGQVEGLGLALEACPLRGQRQVALTGSDNVGDELLAVHAHLHGAPVFCQLLGQLRLVPRAALTAAAALFGQLPS